MPPSPARGSASDSRNNKVLLRLLGKKKPGSPFSMAARAPSGVKLDEYEVLHAGRFVATDRGQFVVFRTREEMLGFMYAARVARGQPVGEVRFSASRAATREEAAAFAHGVERMADLPLLPRDIAYWPTPIGFADLPENGVLAVMGYDVLRQMRDAIDMRGDSSADFHFLDVPQQDFPTLRGALAMPDDPPATPLDITIALRAATHGTLGRYVAVVLASDESLRTIGFGGARARFAGFMFRALLPGASRNITQVREDETVLDADAMQEFFAGMSTDWYAARPPFKLAYWPGVFIVAQHDSGLGHTITFSTDIDSDVGGLDTARHRSSATNGEYFLQDHDTEPDFPY
jgi:hypothetical protein